MTLNADQRENQQPLKLWKSVNEDLKTAVMDSQAAEFYSAGLKNIFYSVQWVWKIMVTTL